MTKREEIEILKQRLEVALKRIEALERDVAKIGKQEIKPPALFDVEKLRRHYDKVTRPTAPPLPILCAAQPKG